MLDGLFVLSMGAGITDSDRESFASLNGVGDNSAANGRFNFRFHVFDGNSITRRALPIDRNVQVTLAHDWRGDDVARSADRLDGPLDFLTYAIHRVQIGTKNLDANVS